mmetsp:Transcript_12651/g.26261  ORF Transcript_12651/g.26261 Transcript_12651/m.26261 type:complete len:199 (-) Transcript_12651:268-864(-)
MKLCRVDPNDHPLAERAQDDLASEMPYPSIMTCPLYRDDGEKFRGTSSQRHIEALGEKKWTNYCEQKLHINVLESSIVSLKLQIAAAKTELEQDAFDARLVNQQRRKSLQLQLFEALDRQYNASAPVKLLMNEVIQLKIKSADLDKEAQLLCRTLMEEKEIMKKMNQRLNKTLDFTQACRTESLGEAVSHVVKRSSAA